MNKQLFFSRQLAEWLLQYEWHFTTLLAAVIEHVEGIPEQENEFVDALLIDHPVRPNKNLLTDFINNYFRERNWFTSRTKITDICIANDSYQNLTVKSLPIINNSKDLSLFFGITANELDWLAQSFRTVSKEQEYFRHYHYSLHKKRDGGYRLLESPKTRLKDMQRQINSELLSHCRFHSAAHGFVKNRNCKTHAAAHINKKYLFIFDLQQCFQSIQWRQVYTIFTNLGYCKTVSRYLTKICTHKSYANHPLLKKLSDEQQLKLKTPHLPQGAPSSPALSNLALYYLDKRLSGLADSLELDYTRYADDLAFSGNVHRNWKFFEPLIGSICLQEGFQLNHRKSRVMGSHQRQKLTGVIVNQKANIDRRYYDQLKAILNNCARDGLNKQNISDHPNFREHLMGSIQYVKFLNKRKGEKLYNIFKQIN